MDSLLSEIVHHVTDSFKDQTLHYPWALSWQRNPVNLVSTVSLYTMALLNRSSTFKSALLSSIILPCSMYTCFVFLLSTDNHSRGVCYNHRSKRVYFKSFPKIPWHLEAVFYVTCKLNANLSVLPAFTGLACREIKNFWRRRNTFTQ